MRAASSSNSNFTVADLNAASILAWAPGSIVPFELNAMARQLIGATCPTAECAIGQGARECSSRFRHRADGCLPPAKAEVRFVYALQHWLPLLEFSVIRDREIHPDRIFGKDRPSQKISRKSSWLNS